MRVKKKSITINVNVKHQSKVNESEKILSNVIADRYEEALNVFSYWSFPFYCEYIQDIEMPSRDLRIDANINSTIMIDKYS